MLEAPGPELAALLSALMTTLAKSESASSASGHLRECFFNLGGRGGRGRVDFLSKKFADQKNEVVVVFESKTAVREFFRHRL